MGPIPLMPGACRDWCPLARADRIACGALAALLALAAPASARRDPNNWRDVITTHDRTRLKDWRTSWTEALQQARAGGFGAQVDAEGVWLQPDVALDQPRPPDGLYRCHIVKLGTAPGYAGPGKHGFIAMPEGDCRVAGGILAKLDGEQRPGGRLFAYDDARLLFLGGMAVGDEAGLVRYKRDPQRALVGLVERIGPQRWRLVLPRPAWESHLDVMEIVPRAE